MPCVQSPVKMVCRSIECTRRFFLAEILQNCDCGSDYDFALPGLQAGGGRGCRVGIVQLWQPKHSLSSLHCHEGMPEFSSLHTQYCPDACMTIGELARCLLRQQCRKLPRNASCISIWKIRRITMSKALSPFAPSIFCLTHVRRHLQRSATVLRKCRCLYAVDRLRQHWLIWHHALCLL